MKRIVLIACAVVAMSLGMGQKASAGGWLSYSGYQPCWNLCAKRYKCLTPEEERLQKFWHDYYDALKNYYAALDHIDWVAYYKNHGYQINGGCGPYGGGRINYAPVFVSPSMQWAIPSNSLAGPAAPMGGGGCGPIGVAGFGGY